MPWVEVKEGKWARVGVADPNEPLFCTVEVLSRPSADLATPVDGSPGRFYDVRIHARRGRSFEYNNFLEATSGVHQHLAHLCLDRLAQELRLTLPCVLGSPCVISIVERVVEVALHCLRSEQADQNLSTKVQALAESMPEFVLGPESPLTYLTPDMPCSIFGV